MLDTFKAFAPKLSLKVKALINYIVNVLYTFFNERLTLIKTSNNYKASSLSTQNYNNIKAGTAGLTEIVTDTAPKSQESFINMND